MNVIKNIKRLGLDFTRNAMNNIFKNPKQNHVIKSNSPIVCANTNDGYFEYKLAYKLTANYGVYVLCL